MVVPHRPARRSRTSGSTARSRRGGALPTRFWDQLGQAGEVLHSHLPAADRRRRDRPRSPWRFRSRRRLALGGLPRRRRSPSSCSRPRPASSRAATTCRRSSSRRSRSRARGDASVGGRGRRRGSPSSCSGSLPGRTTRGAGCSGGSTASAIGRRSSARPPHAQAGGCRVDVTGLNVELVQALPVLVPLADEPPRDCAARRALRRRHRPGRARAPRRRRTTRCSRPARPEPEPVWSSHIGKIVRCTA